MDLSPDYKNLSHIGIATIQRREKSLVESLDSLVGQSSKITVYLNDYTGLKEWMRQPTYEDVEFVLGADALGDLGDAAKFYSYPKTTRKYYLSADDDILYPSDYVESMCQWVDIFDGKVVLSAHGRIFPEKETPIAGVLAHPENKIRLLHFASFVGTPCRVHMGGTGVMCIDKQESEFCLPLKNLLHKERNMADVWISIECLQTHIPIYVISHPMEWLRPTRYEINEDSIYESCRHRDTHREVFNREMKIRSISFYEGWAECADEQ